MPLKHKNTKKSHTNYFVGFSDLVFLWLKGIWDISNNIIHKGKEYFLLLILSLLSVFCFSQPAKWTTNEEKKIIKKATKQFNKGYLKNALDSYQQAMLINPRNSYTNFQIGAIYYMSDSEKINSFPYFRNTIRYAPPKADDTIIDAYYYIGYCYMLQKQYDSAALAFKKYVSHLDDVKENKKAIHEVYRNLQICRMAPGILKRSPDSTSYFINGKLQPVYIKNLGNPVNSAYPEYSQLPFYNDSSILFTSRRPSSQKGKVDNITGEYFEDTYISNKDTDGNWTTPGPFTQQLNIAAKRLHMATVSLSDDGNSLLIYLDGSILQSVKRNGKWVEPEDISKDIKKMRKYYVPSAFFSHDRKSLLIVTDAKGGYGGRDIYICTKDSNGKWSDPKNLGNVINTSQDEDAPFLMPDNKTLFFSSKGHGGLGGYDVFVSHLDEKGNWSKPKNVGVPINSPADDIFFTYNDAIKKGYLSSSRIGGLGDMDLYSFAFVRDNINYTVLKGNIFAASQGGTLPAVTMKLTDLTSKKKSSQVTFSVGENGKYSVNLKPEHKYHLEITCAGYLPYNLGFSAPPQYDPYNLYQAVQLSEVDDSTSTHIGQKMLVKNAFYRTSLGNGNKNAKNDPFLSPLISSYSDTGTIYETDTTYSITYTAKEKDSLNSNNKRIVKSSSPAMPSSIIYFQLRQYELDTIYYSYLNKVVTTMKANKNINLVINGFTDNIGEDSYNNKLSLMRSTSVAEYLYHQGISRSRISMIGLGASQFVAPNDGQHNYLNRRVELQFTK